MFNRQARDDELRSSSQEQLEFAIHVLNADGGIVVTGNSDLGHGVPVATAGLGDSTFEWVQTHAQQVCPWLLNCQAKSNVTIPALTESLRASFPTIDRSLEKPRSYCAASISDGNGGTLGAICLWFQKLRGFDEHDCYLLDSVAKQVGFQWELLLARNQLQIGEKEKDEFLALLAHELRNPLAPISNSLQILRLLPDVNPHVHHLRELIERQVTHLLRLVDDLLDVSRIRRGIIRLRRTSLELNGVIQEATASCMTQLNEKQQKLEVLHETEKLVIDGDTDRLCQALANLVDNASRFMDRGGTVYLKVCKLGQSAKLSIRDTGAGIHEDKLSRVFDLFSQTTGSSNRANSGLGVGLYLAEQIVQLHGGSIEARSDGPGKGSEFIVTLPIKDDSRLSSAPSSVHFSQLGSLPLATHRVLVVDDTRASVYTLGKLLELLGQEVRTAHDAESAMQQIAEEMPDVVITDIAMPNVDGYELAAQIRALPQAENVRLVAVTGFSQAADRLRASESGFDFYFTKPIGITELNDVLMSLHRPQNS